MKKKSKNRPEVMRSASRRPQGSGHAAMRRSAPGSAAWSFPIGVALLLLVAACSPEHAHNEPYTCPMHPTVVSDRPGPCPICGMDLVRKARPGEELVITQDLARLMKSANEVVVATIATIHPEFKSLPVPVEATGVVTYDPRKLYSIPARVGGRLERVYVKYNYQAVHRGQQLAEIYSPELVTAQRELLFLLANDPENKSIIGAAKSRLQLLGLTQAQITTIINRNEPQLTFALYSPYSGYVITEEEAPAIPSAVVGSAGRAGGAMDAMGPSPSAPVQSPGVVSREGSLVREGNYVSPGQSLFKVVNTNALRIELDLGGADGSAVEKGDTVELVFRHGEKRMASVDFVQPFFSEDENFIKVRIYTAETKDLQIGELVSAKINLKPQASLWLPADAVVDLGTQQVVFVKAGEVFRPKKVVTGSRSGSQVEIRSGLASADEIAANAHYLVDSESFIKTAE